MIKSENLDFWIQNHYNVLLVGEHGTGKTSIVKEAFERNGLNWRYYSASTMDPWVDFVGVPKEKINDDGTSYLDLVRPKDFQEDSIEALFFDEFNRSAKKVRNAVMELLQFKSINGKFFPNLKIIWAAINPDGDDVYDVERLDPAQEDRFQIKVNIPYKPYRPYFANRFGEETAKAAISWWTDLPEEQKKLVSPRRLDYALDVLSKGGDVRFVLPVSANVSKLITTLEIGPISDKLKGIRANNNLSEAKFFLANENNYNASIKYIINNAQNIDFFLPCLPNEKLSKLISEDQNVLKFVMNKLEQHEHFQQIIDDIVAANTNHQVVKSILKIAGQNQTTCIDSIKTTLGAKPIAPYHSNGSVAIYSTCLEQATNIIKPKMNVYFVNTQERKKGYDLIYSNIPATMSTEMVLKTLDCLNHIAWRSQKSTLIGLHKFFGIINHCIRLLVQNENIFAWNDLYKKYNTCLNSIVEKCKADTVLGQKLYIPKSGTFTQQWYDEMGKLCP
jgi:hypothetical protein